MIDVSIVIPVYNEAENIIETLTNIENKLLFAHEILIVYDMDNDNTLPVVKSFPPQERCQIRLLKINIGPERLMLSKPALRKPTAR